MTGSNYTGRVARTLVEAFGPYTSNVISEEPTKTPAHEKALYFVAVLAAIALALILFSEAA